jgi:hypothetical protein
VEGLQAQAQQARGRAASEAESARGLADAGAGLLGKLAQTQAQLKASDSKMQ